MTDPFPREEFDDWAESYDASISNDQFPFTGYQQVLTGMVELAQVRQGMSVLDLGTGTGNLAAGFTRLGCEMWCTDFSDLMLQQAHRKLPKAHFLQHDLRKELPLEWQGPFDRIVSAYVFHHFELNEKVRLLCGLLHLLTPDGCMLIGDIAFRDQAALDQVKAKTGEGWEEEYYWMADQSLPALKKAGLQASYREVSSCAGIIVLTIHH